jgi:hypothetical protein
MRHPLRLRTSPACHRDTPTLKGYEIAFALTLLFIQVTESPSRIAENRDRDRVLLCFM